VAGIAHLQFFLLGQSWSLQDLLLKEYNEELELQMRIKVNSIKILLNLFPERKISSRFDQSLNQTCWIWLIAQRRCGVQ